MIKTTKEVITTTVELTGAEHREALEQYLMEAAPELMAQLEKSQGISLSFKVRLPGEYGTEYITVSEKNIETVLTMAHEEELYE